MQSIINRWNSKSQTKTPASPVWPRSRSPSTSWRRTSRARCRGQARARQCHHPRGPALVRLRRRGLGVRASGRGGGLLGGTFLSPGFFLSLSGAIASLCCLRLATAIPGLSSIGYGVLAALAHMAGQFALAYWVLIPHPGLLRLLPVLMTAALVFGFSGGIIARAMVGGMDRAQA